MFPVVPTVSAIDTDRSLMMYMSTSTRSASRLTPAHDVLASAPASTLAKGRPAHAAVLGPPEPPLGVEPVPESPPDPDAVPPFELVEPPAPPAPDAVPPALWFVDAPVP